MPVTRRRKRHTRPEAPDFTVAEYYRRLLSTVGPSTSPTFGDYRRAAGLE